jgi:D-glycero-alpha-D-manno-heptose-7-phosphate kinase
MKINSRAPSRIDFGGGTLDIPFFAQAEKGATLNCAVRKYGYASITENKKGLFVHSLNYNSTLEIKQPITVSHDDPLALLKAAFRRKNFFKPLNLTTYHEMPPHSRLGTSSSIGVAILGALAAYRKEKINKVKIAELATELEVKDLGLANGPQDQYAAAVGGINLLQYTGKKTILKKIKLKRETLLELEKNMLLCYFKSSGISGDLNAYIIGQYNKGNDRVVKAIKDIKSVTYDMHKALLKGNLDYFGSLLTEESNSRKAISEKIVTPLCQKFISTGINNGAIGGKILGAGGGGTILFYSKENQQEKLKLALQKIGGQIFDFNLDFDGLQVWKS